MSQIKNLTDFSTEILVEIFNNLSTKDLLELTLVCKKFNKIISNEEKLQEKLKIFIQIDPSRSFSGTRNNQTFACGYISELTTEQIDLILNDNGKFVKKFRTEYYCSGNICNILKILHKLPNLKIFETLSSDENADAIKGEILPKLNLEHIKTNDRSLLALFMNSQVEKLEIFSHHITYDNGGDPKIFRKFLRTQKNLKHLIYTAYYDIKKDFDDEILNKVSFQLETLEIRSEMFKNYKKFIKFLLTQTESLKSLTFDCEVHDQYFPAIAKLKKLKEFKISLRNVNLKTFDCPLMVECLDLSGAGNFPIEITTKCPKLNSLNIRGFDWTPKIAFEHLENLKLANILINFNIVEIFPNLKSLRFEYITQPLSVPTTLKNLEVLSLYDCQVINFIVPSTIKNLELKKVKFIDESPKLEKGAIVEEFSFFDTDIEWILNYLDESVKSGKFFKFLKIVHLDITYEFYQTLYRIQRNIKKIYIEEVWVQYPPGGKKLHFLLKDLKKLRKI
jgi:hypothetical protein